MSTWVDPYTGVKLALPVRRAGALRSRPTDAPSGVVSKGARQAAELAALRAQVHKPSIVELKAMRDAVHADEYRRQAEDAASALHRLVALHRLRRVMSGRRRPSAAERLSLAVAQDRVVAAQARLRRAEAAQFRQVLVAAGLPSRVRAAPPAAGGVPAGVADFTRPLAGRSFASPRSEPAGYGRVRRFVAVNDAAVAASAAPARASYPCSYCGAGSSDPEATRWHERMHQRRGVR